MKIIINPLLRHVHKLVLPCCALGVALMISGCASTGGGSSGKSISELKSAAERGDAAAQNELGDAYFYGRGVPRNYTEANKWYSKATETYKARMK